MKTVCALISLILISLNLSAYSQEAAEKQAAPDGRKRIAVIQLEAPNDYTSTRLGTGVADMITTSLVKSGVFDVIERVHLDAVLKENKLAEQGLLDPATAVKAGKILGVDYLLGGKVSEFGVKTKRSGLGAVGQILGGRGALGGLDLKNSTARVALDMRLIEVRTGKILVADTGVGEEKESGVVFAGGQLRDIVVVGRFDTTEWSESRIGKATRKAVGDVLEKVVGFFPAEGKVLAVFGSGADRAAILSLGRFSGLKEGMEVELVREEVIRDEDGQVVWTDRKPVGCLRVVEVQNDRAKAVLIGDGYSVAKGDTFVIGKSKDRSTARKPRR
ncbi:MAG: hypothetical protein IT210_22290 [Armatimonadetes bacterium]|nr:hypothetical protein [Armatimonadota bacterium]